MWILIGLAILVAGFAFRLNTLLVVVIAALATGLAAGHDLVRVVSELGKGFNDNRLVSIAWLVLPVIGLLERAGLQERAHHLRLSAHRGEAQRAHRLAEHEIEQQQPAGGRGPERDDQLARPLLPLLPFLACDGRGITLSRLQRSNRRWQSIVIARSVPQSETRLRCRNDRNRSTNFQKLSS